MFLFEFLKKGLGYLSVLCVLLLVTGGVLGLVWRSWRGLLFDVPGFAVAASGFILGVLALLLTPVEELWTRFSLVTLVGICVCVVALIPFQIEFPLIYWAWPLWDLSRFG